MGGTDDGGGAAVVGGLQGHDVERAATLLDALGRTRAGPRRATVQAHSPLAPPQHEGASFDRRQHADPVRVRSRPARDHPRRRRQERGLDGLVPTADPACRPVARRAPSQRRKGGAMEEWRTLRRKRPLNEERMALYRRVIEADLRAGGLRLGELRRRRGVHQTVLADALDVSQPNVSRIEAQDDVYLSTLARYVAALGGDLEVRCGVRRRIGAPDPAERDSSDLFNDGYRRSDEWAQAPSVSGRAGGRSAGPRSRSARSARRRSRARLRFPSRA